jgi:hypothetical protein
VTEVAGVQEIGLANRGEDSHRFLVVALAEKSRKTFSCFSWHIFLDIKLCVQYYVVHSDVALQTYGFNIDDSGNQESP